MTSVVFVHHWRAKRQVADVVKHERRATSPGWEGFWRFFSNSRDFSARPGTKVFFWVIVFPWVMINSFWFQVFLRHDNFLMVAIMLRPYEFWRISQHFVDCWGWEEKNRNGSNRGRTLFCRAIDNKVNWTPTKWLTGSSIWW